MATMTASNQHYYANYQVASEAHPNPIRANLSYEQHSTQAYSSHSLAYQHQQQQQQDISAYHQQQSQQQQQHQQPNLQHQSPTAQQMHSQSQLYHSSQLQQQQQQQQQQQLHQLGALQHQQSLLGAGSQQQQPTSGVSVAEPASPTLQAAANAIYNSLEATKSTKGASKMRRDLINTEIAQLRELLPLPASTRQRLSQLQLMALVLVYVRKSNYFCNAFMNLGIAREPNLALSISGFSKALNGFLMMLTQKGKLIYISDNAAEYLGHSMEDLLSHGDEVYDIIEEQDKKTIRSELLQIDECPTNRKQHSASPTKQAPLAELAADTLALNSSGVAESRIALCRMNVSRNARRQMRFGDQKVVLIEGHYFGHLPLSSRHEPVFLAQCTPIAMPETRECVVQGSTNVFTSIHALDMKFLYLDAIGEHHLGYTKQQITGMSWYELVHCDHLMEVQSRHKRITSNDQERSTIVLHRLMNADRSRSIWVHSVMQVKEASDSGSQPVIVCTNQVLSEREAQVMRANSWLYQFYSLHSKIHCNYSASSPSATNVHANQTETPNSICSDSEDLNTDINTNNTLETTQLDTATANNNNNTTISASSASIVASDSKSPAVIDSQTSPRENHQKFAPTNQTQLNNISSNNNNNNNTGSSLITSNNYAHLATSNNSNSTTTTTTTSSHLKRKPTSLTHSPSSSTISSSPLSNSSYANSSVSTGNAGNTTGSTSAHHQRYHPYSSAHYGAGQSSATNSLGPASNSSSSASSTSSNSSSSSSSELANNLVARNQMAQSMAAASLYATSAGSLKSTIDPLHMRYHSHNICQPDHQHHMASAGHHSSAAVDYASQMMAAQRVAAQQHSQHHNPYHSSYHSHQSHHHQSHHQHQASMHSVHHAHHQTSAHHVSPHHLAGVHSGAQQASSAHHHHHHHHSSAVAAAALYGSPSHHHIAASTALNGPFNQHHHHHHSAYHSTAAAAAVAAASVGAHPVAHNPISAGASSALHQSSYHHTASAAAAAAAAAHQGVPFHYGKIAAAVNASA